MNEHDSLPAFTVIVPARNERENLKILLPALRTALDPLLAEYHVILVDDGSDDGSFSDPPLLKEEWHRLTVISLPRPSGMGAALKAGVKAAPTECVFWMMADFSDDPQDIVKMLRQLGDGSDLVVGNRPRPILPDQVKNLFSRTYSLLARLLFGIAIHDVSNAFRGFRKGSFNNILPLHDDFSISPEMVIKMHKAGMRITEAKVDHRKRIHGTAKFSMFKHGPAYIALLVRHFFH